MKKKAYELSILQIDEDLALIQRQVVTLLPWNITDFFCTINLTDCIILLRHWSKLLSNLNGLHVINSSVKSCARRLHRSRLFNRFENYSRRNGKLATFSKCRFSLSNGLNKITHIIIGLISKLI